jgi:hypothetical protein
LHIVPSSRNLITGLECRYRYQLEAFVHKVKGREPQAWITAEESIVQMEWIEKIYTKVIVPFAPCLLSDPVSLTGRTPYPSQLHLRCCRLTGSFHRKDTFMFGRFIYIPHATIQSRLRRTAFANNGLSKRVVRIFLNPFSHASISKPGGNVMSKESNTLAMT